MKVNIIIQKLIRNKENLEDANKLLSDIEKYKENAGMDQASNVAIVIPNKKHIKPPVVIEEQPIPITKQNKMQLRFLEMLRLSSKFYIILFSFLSSSTD